VREEDGVTDEEFYEFSREELAAIATICTLCEDGTLKRGLMMLSSSLSDIIAGQGLTSEQEDVLVQMLAASLAESLKTRREGRTKTISRAEAMHS
jgi:hypothetical protein